MTWWPWILPTEMEFLKRCFSKMTRVKTISDDLHSTALARCLSTWDITLLGIGHMIGAGIYVLAGTVVQQKAGPSAVLSFLLAGFAALLSALCYAEFGARIPKAGSAYSYVYVTVGELWGFLIGWNIILEHMIGAASVARAWSGALNTLFDDAIRNGTIKAFGQMAHSEDSWISEYPDLVATGSVVIAFTIIIVGAKFSMHFNSTFTILNTIMLLFIIVAGFSFAHPEYWTTSEYGGFFPYGISGTLSGAATCFFAYVGFEGIAIAGEEARDPERTIPRATVMALLTVTVLYLLAVASLTLMVPYNLVDPSAAFPHAFHLVGADWAKYIVGAGTLLGVSTSLLGSAFSLPRSVYAMACDGLLFRVLAYVHPKTQTPVVAAVVFGTMAGIMALLFEITTLVEFMSIGTLFGYTIVAASIIILRYQPVGKCQFKLRPEEGEGTSEKPGIESSSFDNNTESEKSSIISKSKSHDDFGRLRQNLRQIPILRRFEPGDGVKSAVVLMAVFMVGLCLVCIEGNDYLMQGAWWAVLLVVIFSVMIVLFYLVIAAHEMNDAFLTFQIPLVPLIPSVSMLINIALMLSLGTLTWLRLLIWITVGLLVYFTYGIHHSKENVQQTQGCQGYGPMVEYTGEAAMPGASIQGLEQQPPRKEEGLYQEQ